MRKWIIAVVTLLTHHAYAQGVKMSTFPVAPAVDTGHMKLVIVYDAGGSYLNKQLSLGMFARYLSNSFTSSIAGGYGLNYTGMVFKVDSALVFPHVLGTLSAGYGISYASRIFKADTATLFTRLSGTFTAGYGLTYSSRSFKEDTGTTFAKLASTLAAGYGISYGSRTYKVDTATLFPALRSTINFTALSTYNSQTGTSYTLQASDLGKVIAFSNNSAITLTVPAGLGTNFYCTIQQNGNGLITPSASGTVLNIAHGRTKSNGQYTEFSIIFTPTTNTYVLQGDMQ